MDESQNYHNPELHALSPASAPQQSHQKKGKKRPASGSAKTSASEGTDDNSEGGQAMVFPVKLHRMLSIIDGKTSTTDARDDDATPSAQETDASVVSWQPHGRCFLVHDKDAFVKRFLPR